MEIIIQNRFTFDIIVLIVNLNKREQKRIFKLFPPISTTKDKAPISVSEING